MTLHLQSNMIPTATRLQLGGSRSLSLARSLSRSLALSLSLCVCTHGSMLICNCKLISMRALGLMQWANSRVLAKLFAEHPTARQCGPAAAL